MFTKLLAINELFVAVYKRLIIKQKNPATVEENKKLYFFDKDISNITYKQNTNPLNSIPPTELLAHVITSITVTEFSKPVVLYIFYSVWKISFNKYPIKSISNAMPIAVTNIVGK